MSRAIGIFDYPGLLDVFYGRFLRGCLKTYVNRQVGVFLLKLHIVRREHGGSHATDEQFAS